MAESFQNKFSLVIQIELQNNKSMLPLCDACMTLTNRRVITVEWSLWR